ncbi:MAG: FprA family A-type flavoprotein [Bacteroidales bacterium]|jgi:flavorubredoxin|nr:FprA family A-type flavoprotein [Bacteroidales bacterium]
MRAKDDNIIDITDDVKWIGVLDYDIKTFDIIMHTNYGTTYNSYFINARRKAIVEVAKEKFSDVYLAKLRQLTDPAEIEYIILDHTEPDHSGSLGLLLSLAPDAVVVGSGSAIRYLEDIVNVPFRSMTVKDGDVLDLGDKNLRFISAPNLHWPDSIYTYLVEDRVLFTCDSFGAHYCSPDMFADFNGAYQESFRYYFDVILKPFSRFMLRAIDRIRPLTIDYICPGHGPVHSDSIARAVELSEELSKEYMKLSQERSHRNVLIAYISAYGYTKDAAALIGEGISETEDIALDICDIENMPDAELDEKLTWADALLVGSPTINQNTLLPVYRLFSLVNPIRDKGKLGSAFGSYGWSGEASRIILENMRQLKFKVFEDALIFKFAPGADKAEQLRQFGRTFAEKFDIECNQIKNPGF